MEQKYKVNITKYAWTQMKEIKQHISCELAAPQAAKKLLVTMREAAASLETMPKRNPFVDEEKWRKRGIHKAVVENFIMYYWIDEERYIVYVTAVVYEKRNQLGQLDRMDMK